MKTRRREYKTIGEINVTNLVDVVLVLLIVFMISAPLMTSGIELDLPQVSYADTEASEGIVVSVTSKDSLGIFIGTGAGDDVYAGPGSFTERFEEFRASHRNMPVYLRADRSAEWQYVVDIIAQIKNLGVTDLGIVTSPLEGPLE